MQKIRACPLTAAPRPRPGTPSVAVIILCLVFLLLPLLFSARDASALSVGEEKELGEKLLSIVRREFRLLDEPDLSQYVNRLGRQILTAAGTQYFDYHFFIVDNPEFNAFAAPSGLIFLHSGLIETTTSEGELYSVMAHEVGHVVSRHIAHRMEQNQKIGLGTAALLIAGAAVGGGGPLTEALIAGGFAAGESMNLAFSRKDEEEADRLAFSWMKNTSRNPAAMKSMIQKMVRITKYRGGQPPPYLLTHPDPEKRLGYVQDLLYINRDGESGGGDDFIFQRFKTRVVSLSRDPDLVRKRAQLQVQKGEPMGHYGLALANLATARYPEAVAEMEEVRKSFPDRPVLLVDLATIRMAMKDYGAAEQACQEARKADPDDLYAPYILARIWETAGRNAEAARTYETLLASLPDQADLYSRLGKLKGMLGQEGERFYYLGMYYWLNGDGDKATESLQSARRRLPPESPLSVRAAATIERIRELDKKF
ncbi:MAG: M48 family metalloprotease [Thermodesulfobacteriota bacterium]